MLEKLNLREKILIAVVAILVVIFLVLFNVDDGISFQFPNRGSSINQDLNNMNNEYINGEYVTDDYSNNEISPQATFDPNLPVSNENWPDDLPRHIPGSVALHSAEFISEEWFFNNRIPQHRLAFYWLDGMFSSMVDADDFRSWREAYWANHVEPRDEMYLMHFIQYFDIQKEDFIAVVEEMRAIREDMAQEFGLDLFLEEYELPNADIIFTFDPEIISYFYRRE